MNKVTVILERDDAHRLLELLVSRPPSETPWDVSLTRIVAATLAAFDNADRQHSVRVPTDGIRLDAIHAAREQQLTDGRLK